MSEFSILSLECTKYCQLTTLFLTNLVNLNLIQIVWNFEKVKNLPLSLARINRTIPKHKYKTITPCLIPSKPYMALIQQEGQMWIALGTSFPRGFYGKTVRVWRETKSNRPLAEPFKVWQNTDDVPSFNVSSQASL